MSNLSIINGGGGPSVPPSSRSVQPSQQSLPDGGEVLPQTEQTETISAAVADVADTVEKAVERLSEVASSFQRNLAFSVNKDTGDTVIVVSDTETNEVIRQIPSEFSVQLAQNLDRLIETFELDGGLAVDQAISVLSGGSKGNILDASA